MRRSSALILVSASAATLATGWLAGTGYWAPPAAVPTAAPPTSAPPVQPGQSPAPLTIDGAVVETKYGTVQVRVVVDGDAIADVVALKLTDSGDTSVEVSARAAPILREEILAAQSTEVENVTGATFTSEAYLTSAQSALDAAGFTG